MKAVIGTEDDVIGLGLTGINQRQIVPMDAGIQDITTALRSLQPSTDTIYINETLLRKLRYHDKAPEDTNLIMIPDTDKTPSIDEIEAMAKETLGIKP